MQNTTPTPTGRTSSATAEAAYTKLVNDYFDGKSLTDLEYDLSKLPLSVVVRMLVDRLPPAFTTRREARRIRDTRILGLVLRGVPLEDIALVEGLSTLTLMFILRRHLPDMYWFELKVTTDPRYRPLDRLMLHVVREYARNTPFDKIAASINKTPEAVAATAKAMGLPVPQDILEKVKELWKSGMTPRQASKSLGVKLSLTKRLWRMWKGRKSANPKYLRRLKISPDRPGSSSGSTQEA